MNREELKAAVEKAYKTGYYEGFADACDTIMPALTEATIDVVVKLKETAREAKVEAIDELEEG